MRTSEPVRLLDEGSEASSELRGLLGSAIADEPTPEQLASLAARMGLPQVPPGPEAPPSAPPAGVDALGASVQAGLKLKLLVGVAVLTGAGGSFQVGRLYERARPQVVDARPHDVAPTPLTRVQEAEPVVPAPIASPAPAPIDLPPEPEPKPSGAVAKRASTPAPPPVPTPTEDEELLLLDRAHSALLRGDAERALASAQAHGAKFPGGALAQEREVLAIEALVRLGRRPEARTRAEAFSAHYPASFHLIRLQGLLHSETP